MQFGDINFFYLTKLRCFNYNKNDNKIRLCRLDGIVFVKLAGQAKLVFWLKGIIESGGLVVGRQVRQQFWFRQIRLI